MKIRKSYALLILVPLALAIAAWTRLHNSEAQTTTRRPTATLVQIEIPQRRPITQSIQLTGDLAPIQQADVYSRVVGNMERVAVNIGDYVRSGQLLAIVDTTELVQTYRQAAATYQNDSLTLERARVLEEKQLVAQKDYDDAATAFRVAKANFEEARIRLDYAQIRAPFSGFVTKRNLDPGAQVTTGTALFTLMDLATMKVLVNVLEKDVPRVKIGTRAIISADAYPDREFSGAIARMSEAVDLTTRTMPVEIDIPNSDRSLKPGMFARVSLVVGEQSELLTVPSQALLKDSSGSYVLVAVQGVARKKSVQPGPEVETRTAILSGLTPSDSVITTGQQFARIGGPVSVQAPDQPEVQPKSDTTGKRD